MIRVRKTTGSSIYQIFLIAHPTPKKWEVWRIGELSENKYKTITLSRFTILNPPS
jgi:hypothetical protein